MGMVTIKANALEAFVADIFTAAGCSNEEGGRIGRYLVSANLSGHDSHGVVRVPRYATQKKNGTVVADVTVDVLVDTPVIAVVDGKYGFGQTVTPQAVQIGIDKCRNNGLSAVTLRNAGHVGRVGDTESERRTIASQAANLQQSHVPVGVDHCDALDVQAFRLCTAILAVEIKGCRLSGLKLYPTRSDASRKDLRDMAVGHQEVRAHDETRAGIGKRRHTRHVDSSD